MGSPLFGLDSRRQVNWVVLADLIRLSNQTGTWLLMFPSLWALVLASRGKPSPLLLAIFMLGAFIMRSAGVVMNDLADRQIDRQVTRTKTRPLARGALSLRQAVIVLSGLLVCAAALVSLLDPLVIALSPIALVLAAIYPFTKRFFAFPQLFLGLAFGWGTLMAWAAVRHTLELPAWLLFAATVCWAFAYDTIYALQDQEDDRRIGVKSSVLTLGPWAWIAIAVAEAIMLILLATVGYSLDLNIGHFLVLSGLAGFLWWQIFSLRQGTVTSSQAFSLFRQHVWVGGAILVGLWVGSV
ncbi:MAG: 4-hydroxybenzoate octaprenyltransferase [Nitrospirae bacterium]|nr:MAG: 4-hydroxybenzoate octaprenyltransferase [Nitrospirota bacterium]